MSFLSSIFRLQESLRKQGLKPPFSYFFQLPISVAGESTKTRIETPRSFTEKVSELCVAGESTKTRIETCSVRFDPTPSKRLQESLRKQGLKLCDPCHHCTADPFYVAGESTKTRIETHPQLSHRLPHSPVAGESTKTRIETFSEFFSLTFF